MEEFKEQLLKIQRLKQAASLSFVVDTQRIIKGTWREPFTAKAPTPRRDQVKTLCEYLTANDQNVFRFRLKSSLL